MRPLFILLSLFFIFHDLARAQKKYIIKVATHHENFNSLFSTNTWQNNFAPFLFSISKPFNDQLYISSDFAYGKAHYSEHFKKENFWNASLTVQYLLTKTKIQPYLIAGYGITHMRSPLQSKRTHTGSEIGVGLYYWIQPKWGLVFQNIYQVIPNFHNYHQAAIGVSYRFLLQPRDTDHDGTPDKKDKCPGEPGIISAFGCPDADHDGTIDFQDQCPYTPGPIQYNGCPDTDHDGIPDHIDRCPEEPACPHTLGCPCNKNDSTQIDKPTLVDKPTLLKEDQNQLKEETLFNDITQIPIIEPNIKGKPTLLLKEDQNKLEKETHSNDSTQSPITEPNIKDKPAILKEDQNKLEKGTHSNDSTQTPISEPNIRHILFDHGSVKPDSASMILLNDLLEITTKNPTTHIIIEGHADSTGTHKVNNLISHRRARTIKKYLINLGIKKERITTIGHGEKKPIHSNTTQFGRKKNRRVEIYLEEK